MRSGQTEARRRTNPWLFALSTGFFGGVLWGGLRIFFHYFKFSSIVPGFLIEPYFRHSFLKSVPGYLAGWLSFIVFSMLAALLYSLLLRKWKGPWPGIAYGAAWWLALFAVAGPVSGITPELHRLSGDTITSEICLFVLWGLFIGYTISFEFNEERSAGDKK
jgi:branched-subunit amino acid transport protein